MATDGVESNRQLADAVERAREQTLAERTARIEFLVERTWQKPEWPQRRRGGLLRPLLNAAKSGGGRLLRSATEDFARFRRSTGEGFIDFVGRRYMLDYGAWAELYADGEEWGGRSGRSLATLPPSPLALTAPRPLWLLDVLAGVTDVSEKGTEVVRGTECRHVACASDMSRASQRTPSGLASPARKRFEDLLSLPIEVWLDEAHIRRVRFTSGEAVEERSGVELWDFGVPLDDLDWTRLPSFVTT